MQKLIVIAIIASLGWYAYGKYRVRAEATEAVSVSARPVPLRSADAPASSTFRCDGRTHCSQMTSCA